MPSPVSSTSSPFTPSLIRQLYLHAFAISSFALGLLTLRPSTILSIPPVPMLHRLVQPSSTIDSDSLSYLDSVPEVSQIQHLAGLVLAAITTGWVLSIRNKRYDFIYMSVPARLAVSVLTLLTYVVRPERMNGVLVMVGLVDGFSSISLGLQLGFGGIAPLDKGQAD
ncbi:hypothetical protein DV735_g4825, partial [Chaetothyriales sp. CBS 134920]